MVNFHLIIKLREDNIQDKAQHLQNFTCCFWYAVFGFILDSKSREPREGKKHIPLCNCRAATLYYSLTYTHFPF